MVRRTSVDGTNLLPQRIRNGKNRAITGARALFAIRACMPGWLFPTLNIHALQEVILHPFEDALFLRGVRRWQHFTQLFEEFSLLAIELLRHLHVEMHIEVAPAASVKE